MTVTLFFMSVHLFYWCCKFCAKQVERCIYKATQYMKHEYCPRFELDLLVYTYVYFNLRKKASCIIFMVMTTEKKLKGWSWIHVIDWLIMKYFYETCINNFLYLLNTISCRIYITIFPYRKLKYKLAGTGEKIWCLQKSTHWSVACKSYPPFQILHQPRK